jgi:hypothetical protein
MNSALWFLFSRSLMNALRSRIMRLRRPKYFLGALFGGAYFYFYFYRFLFLGDFHRGHKPVPALNLGVTTDLHRDLAALGLLLVLIVFAWLWPSSRAALAFTEAEIASLFPAPLSRTQLLRFKLLRSQFGLLLLALLMTLLTGRFARDGHAWLHTFGWWIALVTLQLHRLGASFVLTRMLDRGLSTAWRRIGVLLLAGGCLALLIFWRQSAPAAPDLIALTTGGELGPYLRELTTVGPAPWLLWPFRLVVQPWFANDLPAFLLALGPALLVIAAHYVWVIRSDVAFEEASVLLSEKIAALVAARRAGNFRIFGGRRNKREPVFALRPTGWAVPAFVWKAWLRAGGQRAFRFGVLASCALLALGAVPWLTGRARMLATVCSALGIGLTSGLVFVGSQATAQGIRRELEAAELLKTAPVPGWQIVLGQILGPALVWSALQWLALGMSVLGFLGDPRMAASFGAYAPALLLGAALVLPPFNVLSSCVPSGVMLLFPGWFRPGEARGIEATGLGLVMLIAQLLFLALCLLVPALVFAGLMFGLKLLLPTFLALLAATCGASGALAGEAWLGAWLLGGVFERFDTSSEQ